MQIRALGAGLGRRPLRIVGQGVNPEQKAVGPAGPVPLLNAGLRAERCAMKKQARMSVIAPLRPWGQAGQAQPDLA